MRIKKSYFIEKSLIDIDEFINATEEIIDNIPCSIAYNYYNNNEVIEVTVACYYGDVKFVETILAPFV